MTLLLGATGWGLIAVGALTHSWHRARLRTLLGAHVDADRHAAAALVSVEWALAIALPIGLLADANWRGGAALAGGALGLGFTAWILRLLVTRSDLPCACSFSAAPTTPWSLARAALVPLVGLWAVTTPPAADETLGALAVGLAMAAAFHLVPEAVSWPAPARAQLARLDSHAPTAEASP